MNKQKSLFFGSLVVLIGLFFIGSYFYKQAEHKKTKKAATENRKLLIRDYSPSIGSAMFKVTLVEFLDPECESCAYFHPLVKKIIKKYENRIHYVVRYAPFHKNSKFAIKVLEGARKQGKYWEALDLLFAKLSEWGSHHDPKPELIWDFLPALDLDIEKIKLGMKDKEVEAMIEQEIKDGYAFGIQQTPTFFINGEPLASFGPEQLEQAIKKAMGD